MIGSSTAIASPASIGAVLTAAAWSKIDWRRAGLFGALAIGSVAVPGLVQGHGHGFIPLVTVVAVLAGSVVSGIAGFAFSAVAGAVLFHVVPSTQAVPLLIACSITTQIFSITSLWRTMQWRQCAPFLAGGILGIPLGATLLHQVDPRLFAIGFGAFLVSYSAYMLLKPELVVRSTNRGLDAVAGFFGGIAGGSVAFPGVAPTIWCSLRGLPKDVQRGVVQPFILIMQFATLGYYSKLGLLTSGTGATYLLCVPAVLAGTALGLQFFKRIDDAMFRRVVLGFLLLSGGVLALG